MEHYEVDVRVRSERLVEHKVSWLRIELNSDATEQFEEIICVNGHRFPTGGATVSGKMIASENDVRLLRFVPGRSDVDVHEIAWVREDGQDAARYYYEVLDSLRRCCHYVFVSCAAARSGFDVNFSAVNTSLSRVLNVEIIDRLKNLDAEYVRLIDVHEYYMLLMRCIVEAENRALFNGVLETLLQKFAWLNVRRKLINYLIRKFSKMSEWMACLESIECWRYVEQFEDADLQTVQGLLRTDSSAPLRDRRF